MILAVCLTFVGLDAQTWDGGGGNSNWGTINNWNPNGVPANDGTANLIFAGGTRTSPNADVAWNFNSLSFASGASAFTLGGSQLTIQAGITNNDNSDMVINNNIVLGASQTWNTAGSGKLTFGGAVDNGGSLLTVVATGDTITFSGVISGSGGLTKAGTFAVTLSGAAANTYSGTTTVNEGTLSLSKTAGVNSIAGDLVVGDGTGTDTVLLTTSNQIADASAVTINTGGVLSLNNQSDTIGSLTMTAGSVTTGSGTLTLAGDVTGNASATTAAITGSLALGSGTRTFSIADGSAATDMSITGAIGGTGGLTKGGAGLLSLAGTTANTYSGTTTVNDGTLQLSKSAGVNAVAGNLVIGDGTGTDTVQLGAANQIANTSNVSINSSGVLNLNGNAETIAGLTMTGGSVITGAGTLTMGADVTNIANSATATITGTLALGAATRTFEIGDGSAADDMSVTALISGTGGLTKSGAGTLNLANSGNSFSGGFTLNAGTVEITNAATIGIAAAGTASYIGAQGITVNGGTLDFSPTGAGFDFTGFNRNVTINGGTIRLNPSSQVTGLMPAGTLTFGASGGTLDIAQPLAAGVNVGNLAVNASASTPGILAYATMANTTAGTAGGWDASGRDLNLNILSGSGALQFNLTGGANVEFQPASFSGSVIFSGSPSGNAGTGSMGTDVGRLVLSTAATTAISGGVTFSNAMQVSAYLGARTLDANITVTAGETAFQGRSTASATFSDLTLGVGSDTLTIKSGATATMDLRFRDDGVNNNVGGIQLNANVLVEDGGTLQFKKTATVASEGIDQINVNADITGQGSTAADSIVNVLLGAGTGGTNGVTFATGAGTAGTDLIINGSGRYGLRVVGSYAALTNLVTTERLQDLTGSGGTLTIAQTDNTARTWSNAPTTATSIKLGFDSSGGSNPTNTLGAAVNDLANFGGLVVKGGVVVAGRDENFIGTGNSTFDITGGTLRLYTLSGARTLTFSGDGSFAGGTIDGGPGGAGKGTLVIGGNLNSDGSTLLNRPNLTMNPNSGTTHIQGGSTLTGIGTFTKTGAGTVQLDQTIDALAIQINQGTLLLGASDRISDTATLSLNGGTFATGGFDETLATLTLTADSRIDLGGAGTSVLNFSDSHLLSWTGSLIITNYAEGSDQIFFGNSASGLAAGQVAQISFYDPYGASSGIYGAEILSDGRIRPRIVPEPATVATLGLLALGLLWRERRRFSTLLSRCSG